MNYLIIGGAGTTQQNNFPDMAGFKRILSLRLHCKNFFNQPNGRPAQFFLFEEKFEKG